jgi:hypothetical protein
MNPTVKKVNFTYSDNIDNKRKFYNVYLLNDDTVRLEWGWIEYGGNFAMELPKAGKTGFDEEVRERISHGYELQYVVHNGIKINVFAQNDAEEIIPFFD